MPDTRSDPYQVETALILNFAALLPEAVVSATFLAAEVTGPLSASKLAVGVVAREVNNHKEPIAPTISTTAPPLKMLEVLRGISWGCWSHWLALVLLTFSPIVLYLKLREREKYRSVISTPETIVPLCYDGA
jgi:hypothetical protein